MDVLSKVVPPVVMKTLTGNYGFALKQIPSLAGRTVIITGGTNGIGLFSARALLAYGRPAKMILLSSATETAKPAINFIKTGDLSSAPDDFQAGFGKGGLPEDVTVRDKANGGVGEVTETKIDFKHCDFSDLKAVSELAKEIAKENDRIDLLLEIAGIGVNSFEASAEGYDKHLLINNIAHVLLTNRLLPIMKQTAKMPSTDVRIVNMSSELHRATFGGPNSITGDKFRTKEEFKKDIGQNSLYARTKLAVILFTRGLLAKANLQTSPIRVLTTHPGAVRTGQQEQFKAAYGENVGEVMKRGVEWAMRTPEQGAMSVLWSAVSDEARLPKYPQGTYFTDPNELGQESSEAKDEELVENFWNTSQAIIEEVAGQDALISWLKDTKETKA